MLLLFGVATARITCDLLFLKFTETILHYFREDYFGLLYLEQEHGVAREKAVNQTAFGGNDYGVDGFHFDEEKRNLYVYQFKYSNSHTLFKDSFLRLIESGMHRIFIEPNKD